MSDNDKNKKSESFDLMQDTQYLLLGLDDTESESYSLSEILAEFGSEELSVESEPEKSQEQTETQNETQEEEEHPKIIAFPGAIAAAEENEEPTDLPEAAEEENLDNFSPEELFAAAEEAMGEQEHSVDYAEFVDLPVVQEETAEETDVPRPLTMEDIVASTVDAVKAENERDQHQQRKRIEKERKKREKKRREPRANAPLPEVTEE